MFTITTTDQPTPTTQDGDELVIDPPVSYDIYRNVHKGIREEMFALTVELGRLDPDDVAAGRRVVDRFRVLQTLLVKHAAHEDEHLDEAIEEAFTRRGEGGRAAQLGAAHVLLEARVDRVGQILDAALAATGTDRRAALHMGYLELAAFVADYLAHQDDEERIVMRALDATFPKEVLAGLDAAIVASIPPEVMGQFLTLMLPAMNIVDRGELLAEIRANAPAEVFAGVWALTSQVLPTVDYLKLASRLRVAVDGRVLR
jgi:hypothetical protein